MYKAILMMLLTIVSNSAIAEWLEVTTDLDGTFTLYVDLGTLRKAGNRVKMWELADYKMANDAGNGKQYMSIKAQTEYDCKEEQSRTLYLSFFSGKMGAGEIIGVHPDPKKWLPVVPDSISVTMWKLACAKR